MRIHKYILVSFRCGGKLHWRLMSARLEGKHYQVNREEYSKWICSLNIPHGRLI